MKNYEGYELSSADKSSGLWIAFKANAAQIGVLKFSHRFYYRYCQNHEDWANCYINGKLASEEAPSIGWAGKNYYQANVKGGIILSKNMEDFVFCDNYLDYYNEIHISIEDLKKYQNE